MITASKPLPSEIATMSGTDLYPFDNATALRRHAVNLNRIRSALSLSRIHDATTRFYRRNL